jgi:ATP-dependent protease ClpP protease subunit
MTRRLNARFVRPVARYGRPDPGASAGLQVKNAADEDPVTELYIYDEIGPWGITASDVAKALVGLDVDALTVRLNTPGGDVFDGLAIYNLLKENRATIDVVVDGWAASCGSVIAMAGDTVKMQRNSMMMIHKAWSIAWGNADELRELAGVLDKCDSNIADIYHQRAGGDVDAWMSLMSSETWFDAVEAKKAGLCDEVLNADQVDDELQDGVPWDLSIFSFAGRNRVNANDLAQLGKKPDKAPDEEPRASAYNADVLREAIEARRR